MKKHMQGGGEHLFILGGPGTQTLARESSYPLIPGSVFYLYVISSLVYHWPLNLYRFHISCYEGIPCIFHDSPDHRFLKT